MNEGFLTIIPLIRLLRRGLEGLGYNVLEASNGHEAVEIAEREHPDLILMDNA